MLFVAGLTEPYYVERLVIILVMRHHTKATTAYTRLRHQLPFADSSSHCTVCSSSASILLSPQTGYILLLSPSFRALTSIPVISPYLLKMLTAMSSSISFGTRLAFIEMPVSHLSVLIELVKWLGLSALKTYLRTGHGYLLC